MIKIYKQNFFLFVEPLSRREYYRFSKWKIHFHHKDCYICRKL